MIKKSVQLTKPKIKETEKEKEINKEKPNEKEKKIEKSKNIIRIMKQIFRIFLKVK